MQLKLNLQDYPDDVVIRARERQRAAALHYANLQDESPRERVKKDLSALDYRDLIALEDEIETQVRGWVNEIFD